MRPAAPPPPGELRTAARAAGAAGGGAGAAGASARAPGAGAGGAAVTPLRTSAVEPDDQQHRGRAEREPGEPGQRDRQTFLLPGHGALYSVKWTGVPALTSSETVTASQLVSRTQPWEVVLPIVFGSGVPWMP